MLWALSCGTPVIWFISLICFLSEFLYNNMKGSNKTVVIITVCYLYCKV